MHRHLCQWPILAENRWPHDGRKLTKMNSPPPRPWNSFLSSALPLPTGASPASCAPRERPLPNVRISPPNFGPIRPRRVPCSHLLPAMHLRPTCNATLPSSAPGPASRVSTMPSSSLAMSLPSSTKFTAPCRPSSACSVAVTPRPHPTRPNRGHPVCPPLPGARSSWAQMQAYVPFAFTRLSMSLRGATRRGEAIYRPHTRPPSFLSLGPLCLFVA